MALLLPLNKVLIVEPEPKAALYFLDWFKDEWKQVDVACCARDAVEIIHRNGNGYDFIYLDLNLPDAVGEAAVKIIMAASNKPIVAETGDIKLIEKLEGEGITLGVYGVVREGSWMRHHIAQTITASIARWQIARMNLLMDEKEKSLAEEKAKWRRDYLSKT